jgi:ketosteroid isomerase-like protein
MSEIERIAERYAAAVYARDEAALLALYDERVVIFDMWDRWSYQGRQAWAEMVRTWFGSLGDERVAVEFEPVFALVE